MHYTVHLTDYPDYVFGYCNDSSVYEFGTQGTVDIYKGKTLEGTWAQLQRDYPGLPRELFTVTAVYDTSYIIVFAIPNKAVGNPLCTTRYILQNDSSLIRSAHSHNARKFRTKHEAEYIASGYGILMDCYTIEAITDEF